MNELYDLLIVDGEIAEINEPGVSVVRFDGLDRTAAMELADRSLQQGYAVCCWLSEGRA